jgi:hypothetical protein
MIRFRIPSFMFLVAFLLPVAGSEVLASTGSAFFKIFNATSQQRSVIVNGKQYLVEGGTIAGRPNGGGYGGNLFETINGSKAKCF